MLELPTRSPKRSPRSGCVLSLLRSRKGFYMIADLFSLSCHSVQRLSLSVPFTFAPQALRTKRRADDCLVQTDHRSASPVSDSPPSFTPVYPSTLSSRASTRPHPFSVSSQSVAEEASLSPLSSSDPYHTIIIITLRLLILLPVHPTRDSTPPSQHSIDIVKSLQRVASGPTAVVGVATTVE